MPSEGREGLQTASRGQVWIWRFKFRHSHSPAAAASIPVMPIREMPPLCASVRLFPNRRTVSAFAQVHAPTYNNARQIAVPTKGK
ncbi:TPA: hypothetical protein WGQ20_000220 [Neisseria meningitidis]